MRAKPGIRRLGPLVGVAVAMLALAATPASAAKVRVVEETFGSAAQPSFSRAALIAVDQSTGDLLVGDSEKLTVSRFKPNGEPDPFPALGTNTIDAKQGAGGKACAEEPSSCDQTPQNGLKFNPIFASGEAQIVVDNSGTVTDGDIYVTQGLSHLVDVFAADGHYLGQLTGFLNAKKEEFPLGFSPGVAVDSGGAVYISDEGDKKILKYVPSANPPKNGDNVARFEFNEPGPLAAGAGPTAGSLFVTTYFGGLGAPLSKLDSSTGAFEYVVDSLGRQNDAVDPVTGHLFAGPLEYDASGASGAAKVAGFESGASLAPAGASGRLYVAKVNHVDVLGPVVSIPDVSTGDASNIAKTSATLSGTVKPDGAAITECFFEWGETTGYGGKAPCAESPAEVGSGTSPVAVHADLSGLNGETTYHYRIVAKNPNGTVKGDDRSFGTAGKPLIVGSWSEDVFFSEAKLKARINPHNDPTTYRFEWGPEVPYANSTAEVPIGSGEAPHTVSLALDGLEAGASYHWRVVATNGVGVVEGPDHTITTFVHGSGPETDCPNQAFRGGDSAFLPDCRAYEMVSPVDKNGGNVRTSKRETYVQASPDGNRIVYGAAAAFGTEPSNKLDNEYLASRQERGEPEEGWSTQGINAPLGQQLPASFPTRETAAVSPDLCNDWVFDLNAIPLTENAPAGYVNLYRQDLCGGGFEALITEAPPGEADPLNYVGAESVQGFSEDLDHVLVAAEAALTPDAPPALGASGPPAAQVYDWSGGALHLVSVLPNGTGALPRGNQGAEVGGGFKGRREHAVSADGSRVYWSAGLFGGSGVLYLRLNPAQPESAHLHGVATGTGNLTGPASGIGNLVNTQNLIRKVKAASGGFAVGQAVSGEGIPAGTTIVKIEPEGEGLKFTLSKAVTITKNGVEFSGAASEFVSNAKAETGAFKAGAEIAAIGIPGGTTIAAVQETEAGVFKLTLSAEATQTASGVKLSATSECTEADKACTVPVSASQRDNITAFWTATPSGSEALYSEGNLHGEEGAELFRFDAESEARGLLAEGVQGVLGASEDLSRIYLVSSHVLTPGQENSSGDEAQAGKHNLYLDEEGSFSFIGTLASGDFNDGSPYYRIGSATPLFNAARVTPDGTHLAFDSAAPLTGYDNTNANNGEADIEVFTYEAGGALRCVSCNPSGQRPKSTLGLPDASLGAFPKQTGTAAAAWIPGWEKPLYAGNPLSDNGKRIFFNSFADLLPRDTNGTEDVYEWEAPGEGRCTTESGDYHEANGGCLYLISTGESPFESEFVDASPDGRDVFFNTESSLVPQDDGLIDIYDARVEGGFPQHTEAAGCEGEACQSPPEAPNDPTPASESFQGAGNVREEASTPKPCAKGKVRRQGKCVAKKHRKRHAKRRANSKRRAGR